MNNHSTQKTFLIEGIIGLDILPAQISDFLNSADNSPVKFQINSPGGFVFDAIAIHNLILQYPAHVEIEILSLCASSASFIATAGDLVTVFPDSVYMLHNAWLFSYGDHNKLREDADHIEKISNLLVNAYSNFSDKPVDEIKSLMDAETFLFGKEIVDNRFAHRLIEEKDFLTDNLQTALDYSKNIIKNSFARMSAVKSFNQDILSASALIDADSNSPLFPSSAHNPALPSGSSVAESALTASAISPGVADFNKSSVDSSSGLFSSNPCNDSSEIPLSDNSSVNIPLFNLFEKLSLIENKIEALSDSFNQSASVNSVRSILWKNQASQNLSIIDSSFFEYRLNALLDSKMILPAHKEIILNIISLINQSFEDLSVESSSVSSELFSLLEKLISLPSALKKSTGFVNLETEFTLVDSSASSSEHFNLPVDPQSRRIHQQILEIMQKYNCNYISAYSIFNQLNK